MSAEDQIRQFAERIVRLEEERKALAADIKDLKAEAKAAGFSPKLIATCVRIMLMEAEKRAEALAGHEELDLYLNAVGLLGQPVGSVDRPVSDEWARSAEAVAQARSSARDEVISAGDEEIRPLLAGSSAGEPSTLRPVDAEVLRETAASASATKVSRFGASDLDQSVRGNALCGTPSRAGGEIARHTHSHGGL